MIKIIKMSSMRKDGAWIVKWRRDTFVTAMTVRKAMSKGANCVVVKQLATDDNW